MCQFREGRMPAELQYFQLKGGPKLKLDPGCSLRVMYVNTEIYGKFTNSKMETVAS